MLNDGALRTVADEMDQRRLLADHPAMVPLHAPPPDAPDPEERMAVIREVLPSTLRSLYMLRISLYAWTAFVALLKIILSPTVSSFLLDLITDTPAGRSLLDSWVHAFQLLVSGLLAASLALVVATFFIQARLLAQVRREATEPEGFSPPGRGLALVFKTLERETAVALLTGVITFGASELLARGATGTATVCGLLAAVAAGALDTLYFQLLFLLREAPVHASEQHYRQVLEQAQKRLADGSMRLHEALIGRFEADYRRTAIANHSSGHSRRQLGEARRQLKARLWVIDRVIPRNQLVAFTAQAKTDPELVERWTEEVDWLVNASSEVRRKQGLIGWWKFLFQPSELVRETVEERHRFSNPA
jgi:hypothetical protein